MTNKCGDALLDNGGDGGSLNCGENVESHHLIKPSEPGMQIGPYSFFQHGEGSETDDAFYGEENKMANKSRLEDFESESEGDSATKSGFGFCENQNGPGTEAVGEDRARVCHSEGDELRHEPRKARQSRKRRSKGRKKKQARREEVNPTDTCLSNSIQDSHIQTGNVRFLNQNREEETSSMWDIGIALGVSCKEDKNSIVEKFTKMKERNKQEMAKAVGRD